MNDENHREMARQFWEVYELLELDSSHDSQGTVSTGSSREPDNKPWDQIQTLRETTFRCKPINIYFERKSQIEIGIRATKRGDGAKYCIFEKIKQFWQGLIEMQSTFQAFEYNNPRTWRQHLQGTATSGYPTWNGKAMQQVALLRRCFFPRRDVIRWVQC